MRKLVLDECAIVKCYEECESAPVVAEKFGCSDETIYRVLKRNGVSRTNRHPKKEPKYKRFSGCRSRFCPALIVMLRVVLDMDTTGIVKVIGCNYSTVSNVISKRGLQRVKPLRKTDLDLLAIETAYLAGASTYELGKKYGVNHATISKWMCECGHRRGNWRGPGKMKTCPECGCEFVSRAWNATYCSRACHSKSIGYSDHKSRAKHYGVAYENGITIGGLVERDKNICQICGGECDSSDDRWGKFGPLYPTIDHIVAMSNGGGHTWSNVQLAHAICNIYKSNLREDELTSEVIARAKEQAATYQCARIHRACMGRS